MARMKAWVKLYTEIIEDPDQGTLTLAQRGIWSMLLALAGRIDDRDAEGQETGRLDTPARVAWMLRCSESELAGALPAFEERGMVHLVDGVLHLTHYPQRQAPISSTERVRQFRQRRIEMPPSDQSAETSWAANLYSSLPEQPGVYCITCTGTGRHYIGATVNLRQRARQHLSDMKRVSDHPMYGDFAVHGESCIGVRVLELVPEEELVEAEKRWIQTFSPETLYNREWLAKRHRDWSTGTARSMDGTYRSTTGTYSGADTERDTDPEERERRAEKTPLSPGPAAGIEAVFVEVFGTAPEEGHLAAYTAVVTDLHWWRTVLENWRLNGYKTHNAEGILDRYRKGPPRAGRNGHGGARASPLSDVERAALERVQARVAQGPAARSAEDELADAWRRAQRDMAAAGGIAPLEGARPLGRSEDGTMLRVAPTAQGAEWFRGPKAPGLYRRAAQCGVQVELEEA